MDNAITEFLNKVNLSQVEPLVDKNDKFQGIYEINLTQTPLSL